VIAWAAMNVLGQSVDATEGRAYTSDFRVFGILHLRRGAAISRFLNQRDRPYVAMTNCIVYREGYEYPPKPEALLYKTQFAALPKSHILWVVGGASEAPQDRHGREPRYVNVMYPNYVLSGRLLVPPRVRVSDFLSQAFSDRPFQELADASVLKPRAGASIGEFEVVERHRFVTVNVALAGGLFDVKMPPGRTFNLDGDRAARTFEIEDDEIDLPLASTVDGAGSGDLSDDIGGPGFDEAEEAPAFEIEEN